MLRGLMMDRPLLIVDLLRHAAQYHGDVTVTSRFAAESPHRYTYRDAWARTHRLAAVLQNLGVKPGDRVATLAWNDYRHFELYYAIPGIGAVCHTVNPRLFPEQLIYIFNHAEDEVLFMDPMFLPLIEKLRPHLKHLRKIVLMTRPELMPPQAVEAGLLCYDTLMDAAEPIAAWPAFDENTAAGLCYTSGTTGNPKGVLYSHRSMVLHAYGYHVLPGFNLHRDATTLVVVPLFHANGWGTPYSGPLTGVRLVFPGPKLDGKSLYELIEEEKVDFSAGVPTVWLGLLAYLRESGKRFTHLKAVLMGGSAAPRAMMEAFENGYGVRAYQGWGMTELSPLGTFSDLSTEQEAWPLELRLDQKIKAGRAVFGVEMKIVGPDGTELPWDGEAYGELCVRGPWIAAGYYNDAEATANSMTDDGWFRTGDISTIDPDGWMTIVDRAKDVIKSGGEWISSIDLENAALAHSDVFETAVIAVAHPKWQERPLLVVVPRPGRTVDKADLLTFLETKVAKWWLPDDIVVLDQLPHTATGKVLKAALRKQFADYRLPTVETEAGRAAAE